MKKQTILIVGIAAIVIGVSSSMAFPGMQNDSKSFQVMDFGQPKAVIIDQLHTELPNEEFHETASNYLKDAGYSVDIVTTEDITVDFYKELPTYNYDYIIIRSHSLGSGSVEESASLFTGEKYADHKYVKEQFLGHVARGIPILSQTVMDEGGMGEFIDDTFFVVGSKMVDEIMVGEFDGSTIILAGCETMEDSTLAQSLLDKGASQIVGWNGLVDSRNNDRIVEEILKETLANELELEQAVEVVMDQIEGKLYYPETGLRYHS